MKLLVVYHCAKCDLFSLSDVNSFSAKWGLELPDFAISSNHGNLRPNYDSDHDIVT